MAPSEEEARCCEVCGTPLRLSAGAPGCLRCLLAGGADERNARQFQHYELNLAEDGAGFAELGRGAMGITYRALDLNLGAPVALKVISARYARQEQARARFRREARAAAQLRHPNVASVFHYGETPEGDCFYTMELVEGETLEARVQREGSLGAALVLEIGAQVARALRAAEQHGLVHRDLKPSNLMLVPNEQNETGPPLVKVIDFGLAQAVTGEGAETGSTQSGLTGTPGFASPEQFQESRQKLDARSDIYSLGATLWFALCGRPPFIGRDPDELREQQLHQPPALPNLRGTKIPQPLLRLLRSMLATDPDERPQSPRELSLAIERCRQALRAARHRPRWIVAATLICSLLAAVGIGLAKIHWRAPGSTPQNAPSEKSIAVLPFDNLSGDKHDASIAAGVQDEILSDLARIADLKVISRTSVLQYASGAARNVRQIGRALGVAKLVEGTVQREGNRLRVSAQLIDARTDAHLWADHYDRDIADVFALQSEIAQEIADQLTSKLSPAERAAIAEPPTTNLNAYEFYVGARNIAPWENGEGAQKSLAQKATLLEQATEHDPAFALAWCALAKTECDLSEFGEPDVHLPLAKKAAENALRLRPNLGEAHRELARYYRRNGEFERGRAEVALARRTLPNDSEVLRIAGEIDYKQNHWDAAVDNLEKALDLDPRNHEVRFHLGQMYRAMRRYHAWARLLAKDATSNGPQSYWFLLESAEFKLDTGDAAGAQSLLARIPLEFSPTWLIWPNRFVAALYSRDYQGASRVIEAIPAAFAPGLNNGLRPNSCADGAVAHFRGDELKAQAIFAAARKNIGTPWGRALSEDEALTYLAYCDAGLGRKSDAVREVEKAVHLGTSVRDPFQSEGRAETLAPIYAWVGDKTHAIEQLELLSKVPGGATYGNLLLDPTWDALRDEPRFKKLVAALKPDLSY
ncbi:MAG: protein kinase [Spartobacteria bacterium]